MAKAKDYLDYELYDDHTKFGGISFVGYRLIDFLEEISDSDEEEREYAEMDIADINMMLATNGIERIKFYTADRETGTFIDEVGSIEEALQLIEKYEAIDIDRGIYEPGFYDVVNKRHISVIR